MRPLLHIAALLALSLQNFGAQQLSAANDVTAPAVSVADNDHAARQMSEEPPEVWRAYDNMSSMPLLERKKDYQVLSSSMKASLWAHHLRKILVEHPEFTPEQVGLIKEYLALLKPELFDIRSDTPEWWVSVGVPLQELVKRARVIFDAKLVRTMFTELAGHAGELRSDPAFEQKISSEAIKKKIVPNTPTCECSTSVDMCIPGWKCIQGGCYFTSQGCGALWLNSCVGLCIEQHGGS